MWAKLGDFGGLKWIPAVATTTLYTQVSTLLHSAPEARRLDSNSKSSEHMNSVEIWSLGYVIYELLVETKFVSEARVCRYYDGEWPFPEDTLRWSPPTDDAESYLLKPMLLVLLGDRPAATKH
ncbi:hypothetical protein B9Z19DRAFT_1125723 [Tuber borchii]|uniref:Protein kinase domain-containing protein n=1 Tax=Tuber borchii TaxID=42251 RepID=A0A2T6ZU25_TUBBO|nr:hypothetical protein B9Z19DRAFT_1125723 [Tuber borchii]